MATYDLLLDTGVHADEGLGVAFSRAAATVGLGGEARASGAPRYAAEPAAIAGAVTAFTTINTGQGRVRMAVGPNADDTGWIYVVFNGGSSRIEVSTITEATGALSTPTNTNLSSSPFTVGSTVRSPDAFCVIPGAIVAFCELIESGTTVGVSFVVSTDGGSSWTVVEDFASEAQSGQRRVREWSMRQWYTLSRQSEIPNDVWVPACDYREPSGSQGWSGYLLHATRDNPASAWTFEVARIRQHDRAGFLGATFHGHSMGLVSDGEGGMIVLVPVGDTNDDNSLIKGHLPAGGDWTEPGDWTWDDSWHGSYGDPATGEAVEGLQGVGMSIGPEEGTLLIGGDTQADAIYLVDARAPKGKPVRVYKPSLSDGSGQECFCIVNPMPHGPFRCGWVAGTRPAAGMSGEGRNQGTYGRVVHSMDGRAWAEVMSAGNSSTLFATTVACSDLNIYLSNHLGASANQGVNRRAKPAIRTMRGLLLNDGATNKMLSSFAVTGSANATITDVTGALPAGTPPVPSLGKVVRIQRPIDDGTTVLNATCSESLASGRIAARVWVLNRRPGGNAFIPSDQASGGAGNMLGAPGGGETFFPVDQWFALDLQGNKASGGALALRIVTQSEAELDLLVCFDYAGEGSLPPPYAIAPGATGPDELLVLDGFDASTALTVYHAFRALPFGVDARWSTTTTHPLLSLWTDADNYILVEALMGSTAQLRLTVVEGGSTVSSAQTATARWARDEQTLLGVAFDKSAGTVGLTFSQAGGLLTTVSVSKGSAFTTLEPTEARVGHHDGTRVFPSMQCALRVIDGQADNQATREGVLDGVDWVRAPNTATIDGGATDTSGRQVSVTVALPDGHGLTNGDVTQLAPLTLTTATGQVTLSQFSEAVVENGALTLIYNGVSPRIKDSSIDGMTLSLSAPAGAIRAGAYFTAEVADAEVENRSEFVPSAASGSLSSRNYRSGRLAGIDRVTRI